MVHVLTDLLQVRGPLVLYQASLPLLDEKTSKFVLMSSGSGTIGQPHGKDKGEAAYGQSKVYSLCPYPYLPIHLSNTGSCVV